MWIEECSCGGIRYAARLTLIKNGRDRVIVREHPLLAFLMDYVSHLPIQKRILDFLSCIRPHKMITVPFELSRASLDVIALV